MMESHLAEEKLERTSSVAETFVYGESVTWARCYSEAGWEEGRGHICAKSYISAALPHSSSDKGGTWSSGQSTAGDPRRAIKIVVARALVCARVYVSMDYEGWVFAPRGKCLRSLFNEVTCYVVYTSDVI